SLWHERDISHSSSERIILPDATIAVNYMLNRFGKIVQNLTVFPENMRQNIAKTYGVIFSQRVLLSLIHKGMVREEAYDLVQPMAMHAWERATSFQKLVEENETINDFLTNDEIRNCFDTTYHLKNVDVIFKRIGLQKSNT